jgi:pimeloyl-ACP methyl ester carboxylesterase
MRNISKSGMMAVILGSAAAGALAILAGMNAALTRRAERRHPPMGSFVEIEGVRLHYLMKGTGPCLVLLHGNASMIEDFACSGLLNSCASRHKVVAFDRPGYGHSPRLKKARSPEIQADLIAAALSKIGVQDAIVLGHSWGTFVALHLALRYPNLVRGLVLEAGYYFPTARPDVMVASAGALPGIGGILCHTVLPLFARASWRAAVRNLFFPAEVPKKFSRFPRELALRPSQLRTSAEESALMIPSTIGLADLCKELSIPTALVCGAADQVVDPGHSAKLRLHIASSTLGTLLFNGHMVHHTSRMQVEELISEVSRLADGADLHRVAE